ncbi:MAG TPA: cell division protein ZapB [Candidatus Binataceae bacterium]|nr:cell division protein ZapB [Candidatus Binataceae bacterium]
MAAEIDILKQLEERIQASVNRIQQLQRENEMLVKRLAESEQRFTEAGAQLKDHEQARGEIRNRIEKILERFNGLDLG